MSRWRYFRTREVGDARLWAEVGGIAVHENIWKSRGRRTCHLLAVDEAALLRAAVELGCEAWWIQRTRTVHFDLVEVYLERALIRCGRFEEGFASAVPGTGIRNRSAAPPG